jgi:hypothetical protein
VAEMEEFETAKIGAYLDVAVSKIDLLVAAV